MPFTHRCPHAPTGKSAVSQQTTLALASYHPAERSPGSDDRQLQIVALFR